MGEISDAMERAREIAQRERDAAAPAPPLRRGSNAAPAHAPAPAPLPAPESEALPEFVRRPAADEDADVETTAEVETEAAPAEPTAARDEAPPKRDLTLAAVRESLAAEKRERVEEAVPAARRRAPRAVTELDRARSARVHRIPRDKGEHWRSRAVVADPQSTSAVRFPHLAVRIQSLLDRCAKPSLLVTSALKGEGKTTVSTNLALALATIASERRVALVDFDLRGASVGTVLQIHPKWGIESALAGECTLDEACVPTDVARLDVYPVAHPTNRAHELLGRSAADALEELTDQYDYVIADGPPVLPVPDTPLLAPLVGGCLTVVRSRHTRRSAFRELMELMPRAQILGVFLNDAAERKDRDAYGYYGRTPEAEPADRIDRDRVQEKRR